MTEQGFPIVFILIIIPILIVLLYLARSKTTGGNVVKKYTEIVDHNNGLLITNYYIKLFQRRFVDGGSLEVKPVVFRTFQITQYEYEVINLTDSVIFSRKTKKLIKKTPAIIIERLGEKYFIDLWGVEKRIS